MSDWYQYLDFHVSRAPWKIDALDNRDVYAAYYKKLHGRYIPILQPVDVFSPAYALLRYATFDVDYTEYDYIMMAFDKYYAVRKPWKVASPAHCRALSASVGYRVERLEWGI